MLHILLLETIEETALDLLANDQNIQLYQARDKMPLEEDLAKIDAVITRGLGQVNLALFDACPKLKVAARCGVGLDNVDVQEATKRGIKVINAPGSNASTVAEHTISFMLTIQRNLFEALLEVKKGNWASRSTFKSDELSGKTLGILGLGNIGLKVAHIASAFGMKVIYWSPSEKKVPYDLVDKKTLFQTADIISLHLPLNEETNGMINNEVFNLMRTGAILINTARGPLVEREALLSALDTGKLGAYAADVPFSPPPRADDALISHPRAFITAHVSSLTATTYKNMCLSTVENVLAVLKGNTPSPDCIFNEVSLGL